MNLVQTVVGLHNKPDITKNEIDLVVDINHIDKIKMLRISMPIRPS